MTILLILLASAVLLELLAYLLQPRSRLRKIAASGAVITWAFLAGAVVMLRPNLFSVMLMILTLYRVINMVRVVEARMHERYLRRATRRTGLALAAMQAIVGLGWWAWNTWHTTGYGTWAVVTFLLLTVAAGLVTSMLRNVHKSRWPATHKHYADSELPTISVLIPARNETEDLQACLQTLVANDYPKLEIIVLDDCSQLRRTPEIIKEFAQAGVRFVQGEEPSDTWLPKNQAYERLAREASGNYLLFCGVDMRFAPGSVRTLATTLRERNKQMICILPLRAPDAQGLFSLIQAMRYWWEIVPPRRQFHRPPVISSSWIISREALQKTGGFAAVARAIVPEAHFARELIAGDGYSFLRSDARLGLTSVKPPAEQRNTAIRMRYPQLHRRPEQVALATFLESTFLILPFVLAVAGFWISIGPVAHAATAAASALLIVVYEVAVLSTRVNHWAPALVGQPLAALADLWLIHYSMWKYEFSTVDWKGRNVCIPVMHVVPHLQKFE